MALFHFGKKNEDKKVSICNCSCGCPTENKENAEVTGEINRAVGDTVINVKVLGAGCKSCHEQYEQAKQAVASIGLPIEVEYITDMEKVMAYGAMSMPALVVNDQVVSMGKVLRAADIEKMLRTR